MPTLRTLFLCLLLLASVLPAHADENERRRDLLERYGVFDRIRDLATDDQMAALEALRISPSQLSELIRAVQQEMPQGSLDSEALKKALTPRFEQILGSETFDTLLELFPTPQQLDRARGILASAAATPEGQAAWQTAQELRAALTPEQASFLAPVLDLAKPVEGATPLVALPEDRRAATKPQRHLVFLRRTGLGDVFADRQPENDHGAWLPRTWRLEGGDANVLAAVSNSDGLPVRVLGTVHGDVLQIVQAGFEPALLPLPGGREVSLGRLPARVVSTSPPTVELDAGRGRKITATLDAGLASELQKRNGQTFLLGGTFVTGPDGTVLYDVDFAPFQAPATAHAASLLLQLSEEFLQHVAREYRNGHALGFGEGSVRLAVDDVGVTLVGCEPGQVRLYGRGTLSHTGLDLLQGGFEIVARADFAGDKLRLAPVPGTLGFRATWPVTAAAPASWITNLERTLGEEYARGTSFALPEEARAKILEFGLLEQAQLDALQLFTLPTPDRRTGLVALAAPGTGQAPPVEVLRSRIEAPAEYALAFSEEALNAALQRKVPGLLPIKREIPRDLQEQGGVRLTDVEIPELDVAFANGQLEIRHCIVNVHWVWGLFSGVEPGIRLVGTANVAGAGDPLKMVARLKVKELEFLSDRIKEMPQEEQQKMKDKLLQTLEERALELSLPAELPATVLSPGARWVVTSLRGNQSPSELLIQGGLVP